MKSVMTHQFSQVPHANIERSVFNRTHGYKTTFDSGYLVPFYVDEALPGDSFEANATMLTRLTTPIVPFMDPVILETFYFAVPYRLVWENWERFNGEQDNPGDSTDFVIPQLAAPDGGFAENSLSDYFGLPTKVANISVSSLWHRAYNLIWNEWFRDENLQSSVKVNKADDGDVDSDFVLLRRGKRHDYFTSALPWPQKGPGVELPIGSTAPIEGLYFVGSTAATTAASYDAAGNTLPSGSQALLVGNTNSANDALAVKLENGSGTAGEDNVPAVYADLSQATAITVNQLREAIQLQKLYERDARGGTRYIEVIKAHFGVDSPDGRLQRPEYLGGHTEYIQVNSVVQTSATDQTSPQGNLAAYGVGSSSGHAFKKSFTEHTLIIGLVNVRTDLTYQQGIPRMFSRKTRFDFYWPALAHLGEQAVLNKEIYAQGTDEDEEVFGYQERHAEYRYFPSQVTGRLRSNASQPLDYWHLGQWFNGLPKLNAEFIQDRPPFERVLAVQNEPQFVLDCYMELKCARPMPVYAVPGLVDHF